MWKMLPSCPTPGNFMPEMKADDLTFFCLEALGEAEIDAEEDDDAPSAVTRVREYAEDDPALRQYFAVVAATDPALVFPPQQQTGDAHIWVLGIGAFLDTLSAHVCGMFEDPRAS